MNERRLLADVMRRSARLCTAMTWAWAMVLALVVLEHFSAMLVRASGSGFAGTSLRDVGVHVAASAPDFIYLVALWWVRAALASFALGNLYAQTIIRMLRRVGLTLAIGAFVGVFVLPGVERLLGADPGYWIAFDVSALVLGAVGLSLSVIASVLRHAAAMQVELGGIF